MSGLLLVMVLAVGCGDDGTAGRDEPEPVAAPAEDAAGPGRDAVAVPEALEVVPAPVPEVEVPALIGPEGDDGEPAAGAE